MDRRNNIISSIDWICIVMYLAMSFFGWMNIYGATYTFDQTSIFSLSNPAGKQFLWMCLSFLLALLILIIDPRTYQTMAYVLYAVWIVLLIVTAFIAKDTKGSLAWINIGPLHFQPAEIAKCITALCLAKWMGRYEYKIRNWRDLVVPLLIVIAPMMIIMVLEKETGTALVFAAFILVLYREGMSGYVLWAGVAAVVLFVVSIKFSGIALPFGTGNAGVLIASLLTIAVACILMLKLAQLKRETLILIGVITLIYGISLIINIWHQVNFNIVSIVATAISGLFVLVMSTQHRGKGLWLVTMFVVGAIVFCQLSVGIFEKLPQHQRKRIEVTLKIKEDAGIEYNVKQAHIAIGSGGFTGKGYKQGTQTKLRFVPEQHTDFIISTIGEEFGFLGTFAVVVVYMLFILRLIYLAERQKDMFSQIYGYSVACIFLIHFTINIGMVLGFLPVIGIPLPFYSYGGSSMLGFTLLLFIFLKLDATRVEKL